MFDNSPRYERCKNSNSNYFGRSLLQHVGSTMPPDQNKQGCSLQSQFYSNFSMDHDQDKKPKNERCNESVLKLNLRRGSALHHCQGTNFLENDAARYFEHDFLDSEPERPGNNFSSFSLFSPNYENNASQCEEILQNLSFSGTPVVESRSCHEPQLQKTSPLRSKPCCKNENLRRSKCFHSGSSQNANERQVPKNMRGHNERKVEEIDLAGLMGEGKDPVSLLHIWCDQCKAMPVFTITTTLNQNQPEFTCTITLLQFSATGKGRSKKESKKTAAFKMLDIILSQSESSPGRKAVRKPFISSVDNTSTSVKNPEEKKEEMQDEKGLSVNPISRLQEICMKQKWAFPDYRAESFGSIFKCGVTVYIKSEVISTFGLGQSKKEAKFHAAKEVLKICQSKNYISDYK